MSDTPRVRGKFSACQLILLVFLSTLTACIPAQKTEKTALEPIVPLPAATQAKVLEAEKSGDLLKSLDGWKKANSFIIDRINVITAQLAAQAEESSTEGAELYKNREIKPAFEKFVEALKMDPNNGTARDYLITKYRPARYLPHTIRKDENYASMAEEVYGSESLEVIARYFSMTDSKKSLVEGNIISLPTLDSFYSPSLNDYRRNLLAARKQFKYGQYEKAVELAAALMKDNPTDEEPSYIFNMSLLKISSQQVTDHKFDQAISTLEQVDPNFKNLKDDIAEIRQLKEEYLQENAQLTYKRHYMEGIKKYRNGDYLSAIESFQQVAPDYEGIAETIIMVENKIKQEAESHFKEGVKLFVEERLEDAITEWEKALKLDPNHANALSSVEKARHLLEKVNKIN